MERLEILILTALAVAGALCGQPGIAGNPKVEIKGKIDTILVARGQGMPSLELRTGDKTVRVVLGSMRYLMEQEFNPKAGDEVAVTGYKLNDDVVAITVTLTSTGKVLRLRDAGGRPVWMGGRRGGPMNRSAK